MILSYHVLDVWVKYLKDQGCPQDQFFFLKQKLTKKICIKLDFTSFSYLKKNRIVNIKTS